MVGYAVSLFFSLQYFKTRKTLSELKEIKQSQKQLVKYGNTFYGCSTGIYQAWLQFIPEIRPAFWKYFNETEIPLFTPDPQFHFIIRHPELFEIINPPSQDEIDLIEQMYNPIPTEQWYNPLQKQKNFLNHGRLLIFLAGVVSKLIHNTKVPQSIKGGLRRMKQLIQQAAEQSMEFAINDSAKPKLFKAAKAIVTELEFHLPVDKNFSVQNQIKEIQEELTIGCSPKPKL